ncbi:MAG: hypothetical protein ACFBSC_19400 [Microcoleaceae cyanobacterium]
MAELDASRNAQPDPSKISTVFANRLASLDPQQQIQVLVFLKIEQNSSGQSRSTEAVIQQAEASLSQIRGVISQYNGQLLAEQPSALATMPVQISVEGVYALAQKDAVKSIVENQALKF